MWTQKVPKEALTQFIAPFKYVNGGTKTIIATVLLKYTRLNAEEVPS